MGDGNANKSDGLTEIGTEDMEQFQWHEEKEQWLLDIVCHKGYDIKSMPLNREQTFEVNGDGDGQSSKGGATSTSPHSQC